MKTIVLSGGHVSPAVAIAEECQKRGYHVVVFGRPYAFSQAKEKPSLEKEMFEEMGVDFKPVEIGRVPRSPLLFPLYIASLLRATNSIRKSLKDIKPVAVMSFGGYVSIPILIAAVFSGIPIFLHEQTTTAGLSNKIFYFFAQKVFISWPETAKTFPPLIQKKIVLTGNPVRQEILSLLAEKPVHKKELTIYITGGSTGAHAINVVVASCLDKLLENYIIIHQAGDSHFNDFEMLTAKRNALPEKLQKKYHLARYINLNELKDAYLKSDILVGRSGANTVVEATLLGKPSIFIPLPLAQYNEQELLAKKLADHGAATILNQKELTDETLLAAIASITKNYETYVKYGKAYRESEEITCHKDASRSIVDFIESNDDRSRNISS